MAFEYAIKKTTVIGDIRKVIGTFTNGAQDTGGAISTGLNEIFNWTASNETTAASTVILGSRSAGTLTITTPTGEDGVWSVEGV